MRSPWIGYFPPVLVQSPWRDQDHSLRDHPQYMRAKKGRDIGAAVRICDDIISDAVLNDIYSVCAGKSHDIPFVVAPALSTFERNNALALTYANVLAKEMGWIFKSTLLQRKSVNRDFNSDEWFRLANDPEFYGSIEQGKSYVIADDVCTSGGTLASMRGFIESNGGRVICMTALASGNGRHVQIAPSTGTLTRLSSAFGGELARAFREEMGYPIEHVTDKEAQFLLRCLSPDAFRAGIIGGRNA